MATAARLRTVETNDRGEWKRTMDDNGYGLWALVIIDSAVFIFFALSYQPAGLEGDGSVLRLHRRSLYRDVRLPSPFTC